MCSKPLQTFFPISFTQILNVILLLTASLDRLKELASAVTNSTWTLNNSEIDDKNEHNRKSMSGSLMSGSTMSIRKPNIRDPRRIFVVR